MSSDDLWTDRSEGTAADADGTADDRPERRADDPSRDGTADDASPDGAAASTAADAADGDGPALERQVELLAAENRRLRAEYVDARRTTHRRTAVGLAAVGAVALLGAVVFAGSRTVLFALGFTGLFGAVLTYFLTPERFVAADTGERVYAAAARNGDRIVGELGLQDDRVYAPAPDGAESPVKLFVPHATDYEVPEREALADLFVVAEDGRRRGVSLFPTGGLLYREFERAVDDDDVESSAAAAGQLADALVEVFELVESATPDLDAAGGRLTVEVADSAYGEVDRFDHPVASLVAVGMAATLDEPVTVEVMPTEDGDGDGDYLITCTWDADGV
jgi:hypothetical protein